MKRSYIWMMLVAAVAMAASTLAAAQTPTQTQSLGDYARAMKKAKSAPDAKTAAKVYDNDNLPATTAISVVGDSKSDASSDDKKSDEKDAATDPDGSTKKDEKKPANPLKPGQSAEERQKALKEWQDKMSAQKDKIGLLSRELEVLQREQQIKAAEFYANTARRTQNPNGFVDDDAKYKKQITDKQKQLDDATNKLSDMQDEARKSGAPNSITQ
jgi:hypothetical protein